MDNKLKIALVVFVLIGCIFCVSIKYNFLNNIENDETYNITVKNDEETSEYIVYNEKGDEILRTFDESEIQLYKDNPDFNPMLPDSAQYDEELVENETFEESESFYEE